MKINQVKQQAFSMPLTSPSYPKTEFKFVNREFLVITYETDIEVLREVVPEPLQVIDPIVKFEFIRMPDSAGFGNYTESGQVIPVEFNGEKGSYIHSMYLDDVAPISGGREIWGFPKKYAHPTLGIDVDSVLGKLKYNSVDVAIGTMSYKYHEYDKTQLKSVLENEPGYLLKIIPNCNGKDLDICQLVKYYSTGVTVKGAWTGPAALQLFQHALAPVALLPVKRVISGMHFITDLTLGFGEVVHDYLT
ncbi:MAG: acetoacetate decarboxylase [Burkholderiales bacterium]